MPALERRRGDDGQRFSSLAVMRATQATLPRIEDVAGWEEIASFIIKGCATGALLHDDGERWAAQSVLDYCAASLARAGRAVDDSTLAPFDPEAAPTLPEYACPYVGLQAFGEENASYYFGRRAEIEKLRTLLIKQPLVSIVGTSGSGKSSLARAGLALALRPRPGEEPLPWRLLPPVVPGAKPLEILERSLPASKIHGLCILVVDQLEELFTLCTDETTQARFVEQLLAFIADPLNQNRIILTIRSDFEDYLAKFPEFYRRHQAGRLALLPLGPAELREVIEAPAEAANLRFEPGVVDALVKDLLGEPAGLPLLQTSLLRLWATRRRNVVSMEAYQKIGGGRRALAEWADEVYEAMIPEDQTTARRILLRLGLSLDDRLEVTRARITRADLHSMGDLRSRVDSVLSRLVEARLVRLARGEKPAADLIEVAHEALVRNWPRLGGWLGSRRQDLRTLQRLRSRAAEWSGLGSGSAGLLDAVQLHEAEQWLAGEAAQELGSDGHVDAFIYASRRWVSRSERQRRTVTIFGAAFLSSVAVAGTLTAHQYKKLLAQAEATAAVEARLTRDLAAKHEELTIKTVELARTEQHVSKALRAFDQVTQMTQADVMNLPIRPEVPIAVSASDSVMDPQGARITTFRLTPDLGDTPVTGIVYVVFGKLPRLHFGVAPSFQAVFQLRSCQLVAVAAVGYRDRDPVVTRFDLCARVKQR